MKRRTRTDDTTNLNILGETPSILHLQIHGSRLPSNKQIILCYLAHLEQFQSQAPKRFEKFKSLAITEVLSQIKPHYLKAGIVLKSDRSITYAIEKLNDLYQSAKKKGSITAKKQFMDCLNKTMILWPKGLEQQMEAKLAIPFITPEEKEAIRNDLYFIKSMKTDRVASYSCKDKGAIDRLKRTKEREAKEHLRLEENQRQIEEIASTSRIGDWSDDDIYDDIDEETERQSNELRNLGGGRQHKRRRKIGTNVTVNWDFAKREDVISMAKRNKLSASVLKDVITTFISA